MRLLVKIGGAQLVRPEARQQLAQAVAAAKAAGHQVLLVHGGGDQIRKVSQRLGLEDKYHQGLRITDAETADVVLQVLGGQVNRTVVASLQQASVRAVGLTGADGETFLARKHTPQHADLGYVGAVHRVNPALVETLLELGIVPVLATVAPLAPDVDGDREHFYNINADQACGPLAHAFGADAVLFLTDVPGVLDQNGHLFCELDAQTCALLEESGVIEGGMIPKIAAALGTSHEHGCGLVKIAPAQGENAILHALASG
ncbi:MAG: acetylglutamate kinase, partial [Planctomycetota bacterium]